jgi:hypothetical protein
MPTELVLSVAHGYGSGSPSSIANPIYNTNQIVFISLDIETGGEYCGICQLSAEFNDMEGKDIIDPFDSNVKPPNTAIWSPKATEIHGLHGRYRMQVETKNPSDYRFVRANHSRRTIARLREKPIGGRPGFYRPASVDVQPQD